MALDRIIQSIFETDGINGLKKYIYNTTSDNTKVSRLYSIRSYFKNLGRDDLLSHFPKDEKLLESFREGRQEYLDNELRNKIEVYFSLEEYKEIENKLRDYYCSVYSLILAGINSGRRISELTECTFSKEDKYRIKLENPLKKRGKVKPVVFPLLFCSSNTFLNDIKTFKESGLTQLWVQKKLSDMFAEVGNSFSFHTLRSLYGYYSYELYCNDPSHDRIVWLSDVLGHDKSNYTSTLHYSKYFERKELKKEDLINKIKIYLVNEIGKPIKRDYSKKEGLRKKISRVELNDMALEYLLKSNAKNKRESQYENLCKALSTSMGNADYLILEQSGMINEMRKLYKRIYNKDISGRILKEFYNDFWGYNNLGVSRE